MISIDPSDKSCLKSVARKGRLVRSLDFTANNANTTATKPPTSRPLRRPDSKKTTSSSIWRDPLKSVLPQSTGFTTHKMSSVTNNFMSSSELNSSADSSEIDEMVGDLVDPGRATLVFPQHDEVFRTSPLSSSSSFILEDNETEDTDTLVIEEEGSSLPEFNFTAAAASGSVGMSWNPKRNQWIPLVYRYVFPSSAFSVNNNVCNTVTPGTSTWSLKNGQLTESRTSPSFSFPPPKKSIMMGPNGLIGIGGGASHSAHSACKIDLDARDVCEKLLELMDDENLMLPVVKISTRSSSPVGKSSNNTAAAPAAANQLKTLLSEWSSLPSSPPPPIFHDVCNRPIPELRLSPPMTGKSFSKRLFPVTSAAAAASTNSPCESPLAKRLRFSSSSSSIASQ